MDAGCVGHHILGTTVAQAPAGQPASQYRAPSVPQIWHRAFAASALVVRSCLATAMHSARPCPAPSCLHALHASTPSRPPAARVRAAAPGAGVHRTAGRRAPTCTARSRDPRAHSRRLAPNGEAPWSVACAVPCLVLDKARIQRRGHALAEPAAMHSRTPPCIRDWRPSAPGRRDMWLAQLPAEQSAIASRRRRSQHCRAAAVLRSESGSPATCRTRSAGSVYALCTFRTPY